MAEKFERNKQIIQISADLNNLSQYQRLSNDLLNDSSRSNSIKGRKMSVCDPRITISNLSIEKKGRIQGDQSQRDTLARVSQAAAKYPLSQIQTYLNQNEPTSSFINPRIQQITVEDSSTNVELTERNLRQINEQKRLSHAQSQAVLMARRGNHNPRQKSGGGKKKLRKSLAQVAQAQAQSMRHQYSIRPATSFNGAGQPRAVSSLSRLSAQNKSDNRTPSHERNVIQHSQSQGSINTMNRKQLIFKAVANNRNNPTGFQLTFNNKNSKSNKKHDEAIRKSTQEQHSSQDQRGKNMDKPLQIQNRVVRPKTSLNMQENLIMQAAEQKGGSKSNSSTKNRCINRSMQNQPARSTSPSPKKKSNSMEPHPTTSKKQRPHTSSPICNHTPSRKEGSSVSPSRERLSSHSIDKIIKENLKKQSEIQKEKLREIITKQAQEKERKKQIDISNRLIRERNLNIVTSKKHNQVLINPFSNEKIADKSPRLNPKHDNRDMPLKLKDKSLNAPSQLDPNRRKKYDLGLDIFDLKRELGMGAPISSSRGVYQNHDVEPNQHQTFENMPRKPKASSASAERPSRNHSEPKEGGGCSTHRKKKNENEMKKLVERQQKEWLKKIKQEKMQEIMKQQKVLTNLKQLNKEVEQQRAQIKRVEIEPPKKKSHFKTVDEQEPQQVSVYQKKKKSIVNIQVKPDGSHAVRNSIDTVDSTQYPGTTKEKENKSFSKLKSKNRPKKVIERPQTAAGIVRVSIDNNLSAAVTQDKPKNRAGGVFSYFIRGSVGGGGGDNKENKNEISSIHNKSAISHQHQSIITDRSQIPLKKLVIGGGKQKKKASKSKTRLIMQLMRQLEEHKQEIEALKQNYSHIEKSHSSAVKSRSKSKERRPQTAEPPSMKQQMKKPKSPKKFNELPAQMIKSQSQVIENTQPPKAQSPQQQGKPRQSTENEKILIDDDMMIFCVLTTAASIIQKKYREYRARKNQFKNASEEFKESSHKLSESARLEDRFLPVIPRPQNKRPGLTDQDLQTQKKSAKHTFSFGHSDDHPQFKVPQPQPAVMLSNTNSSSGQEEAQLDPSLLPSQQLQYQEPTQPQLVDQHISFIADQSSHSHQTSKAEVEEEDDPVEKALKINDKFKFALRDIAEKQKKMNLFDQIKKKKKHPQLEKEAAPIKNEPPLVNKQQQQREQKYYIKDDGHDSSHKEEEPSIIEIQPSNRDNILDQKQDLVDLSKLSIEQIEEDDLLKEDLSKVIIIGGNNNKPQLNNVESLASSMMEEESKNNKTDEILNQKMDDEEEREILQALTTKNQEESQIDSIHIESDTPIPQEEESKHDDVPEQIDINQIDINLKEDSQQKYTFPTFDEHEDYKDVQRYQSQKDQRKSRLDPSAGPFDYMTVNKVANNNKQVLRMMFGDEKFLQDHDYLEPQSPYSHSKQGPQHEQFGTTYFLATNTSLFERNPFQDFTTHALHDLLQGKNYAQIVNMREEALRYQENLEKGYINRLEKRQEASPASIQRRRFELEKWVSLERKNASSKAVQHPINVFDLEEERRLAALIIERVNKKTREIKEKILASAQHVHSVLHSQSGVPGSSSSNLAHAIEEAKSSDVSDFINKQLQQTDSHKPEEPSQQHLQGGNPDDVVELTFDEYPSEEKDPLKRVTKLSQQQHQYQNELMLDISIEEGLNESEKVESPKQNDENLKKQTEELTEEILREFLQRELISIKLQRESNDEEYEQIREIKSEPSPVKESAEEEEPIPSQEPVVPEIDNRVEVKEEEKQQQVLSMGIDTSEAAIDQYIEEIFEQIRPRKEQFLQAFITPIYKNPLDVLTHLQKPEYGTMSDENGVMNLLDATSSLAYILNVQLYLTLEKAKENVIHETIEQIRRQYMQMSGTLNAATLQLLDDEIADLMSEAQHIHNKVIFDCVNEGFNMVRPYGNQGEPMPWSKKPRRNLIFLFDSADDLDQILVQVKSNVLSWAKIRAGALPPPSKERPQQSNVGMPLLERREDAAFSHQRERCLAQLLAQDLVRDEDRWLDYEMEEAQIKIDLSDIVLEQLVSETVDILNQLKDRELVAKQQ